MNDLPPIQWFRNPNLPELTPLTVTPEGRVFGHIAAWGQNHLSFPGRAIKPPRSRSDYRWFHTGTVDVIGDDGEPVTISVGKIAQGAGHAGLHMGASETASYYDNSASIVAVICAFDDDPNGIAFSGAIMPDVDQLSVRRLKACGGVSGDWRVCSPGSGLELVACLAVPTGGFAIPRARVASGAPMALVAAGMVQPVARFGRRVAEGWSARPAEVAVSDVDTLADAIAGRLHQRQQAGQLSARHAALVAALDDTPDRAAALLAELDDSPQRAAELLAALADDVDPAEVEDYISRMPPQLQREWLAGGIAARIAWGTPGSYRRCLAEARSHDIPARMQNGLCANLYHQATGRWPGANRD